MATLSNVDSILKQLARDQFVQKTFTVSLSSLQLIEANVTPNKQHYLQFECAQQKGNKRQQQMLSLSDVFAISHSKSCDTLQFFASLKVRPSKGSSSYSNANSNHLVKNQNEERSSSNVHQILRLGVYDFKLVPPPGDDKEAESFLALYDELTRIVEARNTERKVPQKLLLFVNPHSGENMKSCRVFVRYVLPMLKLASMSFKVIVLTYPSNPLALDAEAFGQKWQLPLGSVELVFEHPYDYCYHNSIEEFDGVISVSGDGTLSDAVLGVLKRQHGDVILPTTAFQRLEHPVFGIIPAGSTDSMALTIHGNSDPLTAVLSIISGDRIGIDVQALFDSPGKFSPDNPHYSLSDSKFQRFCFTAVGGGGFMPKVIEMSKELRSVFRAQRFAAAAVPVFMANKPAALTVYYKKAHCQPVTSRIVCGADCKHCQNFSTQSHCNMSLMAAEEPWARADYSEYMGVNIASNASLSRYQSVGLSPHAHLGDGTADLVLNKHEPTIFHYLMLQRKVSSLSANMYNLAKEGLDTIRVWEYSVEPTETADSSHRTDDSIEAKLLCSSDGELFRCRRLHGVVHCRLFYMYGCGRSVTNNA